MYFELLPLFVLTMISPPSMAVPPAPASTSIRCAPGPPVLRLYVVDAAGVGTRILEPALFETAAIWARANLHVDWTFSPDPVDRAHDETVVLVIKRQTPAIGAARSNGSPTPPLGQVQLGEDGRPTDFIEVSLEAIRSLVLGGSLMDRPVVQLPHGIQQILLGQAIGRVVAHEIGHWVAGREHAGHGLMKPAFTAFDLVAPAAPRLPAPWTTPGAGTLVARFPPCSPTPASN
jgi:hypothetical protein